MVGPTRIYSCWSDDLVARALAQCLQLFGFTSERSDLGGNFDIPPSHVRAMLLWGPTCNAAMVRDWMGLLNGLLESTDAGPLDLRFVTLRGGHDAFLRYLEDHGATRIVVGRVLVATISHSDPQFVVTAVEPGDDLYELINSSIVHGTMEGKRTIDRLRTVMPLLQTVLEKTK